MNKYLAIALCLVCAMFVSCTSKEQKAAEAYLKDSMKSPSTFKVISVEKFEHEPNTSFDTLYHVGKIYETLSYGYRLSLDSIAIDSIQIWRIEYPAYIDYDIEYDAANSYGAILRDFKDVYVTPDGETYFPNEFFGKFLDEKKLDRIESYSRKYNRGLSYSLKEGAWISSYELGMR